MCTLTKELTQIHLNPFLQNYLSSMQISNIRQKRKSLDSQGLEACEPKPKKGPNLGAVTLTKDRIDRFNAIDFAWNLSGPNPRQSWEERFEQMMEYYRENGRWPPHSHGTLGEW
jgi:hypothetical protein